VSIAVLGRGLMGSAAARHLSAQGHDVVLIGPGEPEDKRAHQGIFASHYDEGRITRKNALDAFWTEVSAASIARYSDIEAQSGIQFFTEAGAAMAGPADYMAKVDTAGGHGVALDAAGLAAEFPFFKFPDGFSGRYEATGAGHVSPRRLVAAQTEAARMNGAQIVDAIVVGFKERPDHVQIVTQDETIRVDRVLVATGYMTDMLLGRPKHLDVYARTVAFFEISEAEKQRLARMPSLVFSAPEDPYLLPPIQYPDGKIYVKLGGDPEDVKLHGEGDIHDWFRSGGNAHVRDRLEQMIVELMPDLDIQSVTMDACVTSWTSDRKPEIRNLTDKVAICTGGNGAGAKCSDELGRRGAALVSAKIGEKI
jgi:sarcosine oxidase